MYLKTIINLTIFVTLLTSCSASFAAKPCEEIFLLPTYIKILAESDLKCELLGSPQVLKITSFNGKSYALRISADVNDLSREHFIYELISNKLNLPTPRQELLDPLMIKRIIHILQGRPELNAFLEDAHRSARKENRQLQMSITEWLPMQTGEQWLKEKGDYVFTFAGSASDSVFAYYGGISPLLKKNISTMWIALTVLGVLDRHYVNWLTNGNTVWAIDLAQKFSPITNQNNPLQEAQSPTSLSIPSLGKIRELARESDPLVLNALKKMTRSEMEYLAKKSGYKLQPNEFESFQQRLLFVIGLRENSGN